MKLLLLSLTADVWNSPQMRSATEEAQDAARRIRKKLDVRRERKRFSLACERIESIATGSYKLAHTIEGAAAKAAVEALPREGAACYPFAGPQHIKAFMKVLPKEVAAQRAVVSAAVVVLATDLNYTAEELPAATTRQAPQALDYTACDTDITAISPRSMLRRTHQQIRSALETGRPIGWVSIEAGGAAAGGLSRHEVLVTALREYIYLNKQPVTVRMVKAKERVPDRAAMARRDQKWWYRLLKASAPALLPRSVLTKIVFVDRPKTEPAPIVPVPLTIAFRDGTQSAPFPLFSLVKAEPPQGLRIIRVALVSSRHMELDGKVDICLLRNSEISRREEATIAEQEQFAYTHTRKLIQSLASAGRGVQIDLYHTGLEPAILGAYRAIVDCLRLDRARGKLLVVPKIYRGSDRFDDLKPWY